MVRWKQNLRMHQTIWDHYLTIFCIKRKLCDSHSVLTLRFPQHQVVFWALLRYPTNVLCISIYVQWFYSVFQIWVHRCINVWLRGCKCGEALDQALIIDGGTDDITALSLINGVYCVLYLFFSMHCNNHNEVTIGQLTY